MYSTRKTLVLAITLVVVFVIYILGSASPVNNLITKITEPFYSVFYNTGNKTISWFGRFRPDSELLDENKYLKERNDFLTRRVNELESLVIENESLKSALGYASDGTSVSVLARIIGQTDLSGATTLLIDKGENDGVFVGNLVTNERGELIGDVILTTRTSALMRLITHPDFSVAIKKQQDVSPLGILEGDFSLSLRLNLIPLEDDLRVGDVITTARIGNIPENIVIGEVESIEKQEGGLFKSAILRPYSSVLDTLFVHVVRLPVSDDDLEINNNQ